MTSVASGSRELADRLVAGIAALDQPAIASCFSDDAELRALIPSGLRERKGATDVAALIHSWFKDSTELALVTNEGSVVGDRLHIAYRFTGIEEGAPYVVEQQLFCTVTDGRITTANLVCSGFRPNS